MIRGKAKPIFVEQPVDIRELRLHLSHAAPICGVVDHPYVKCNLVRARVNRPETFVEQFGIAVIDQRYCQVQWHSYSLIPGARAMRLSSTTWQSVRYAMQDRHVQGGTSSGNMTEINYRRANEFR